MFHYCVRRADTGALLDDSRSSPLGPFELRLGKGFALAVWEQMVRGMGLGERASFVVKPEVRTRIRPRYRIQSQ